MLSLNPSESAAGRRELWVQQEHACVSVMLSVHGLTPLHPHRDRRRRGCEREGGQQGLWVPSAVVTQASARLCRGAGRSSWRKVTAFLVDATAPRGRLCFQDSS